MNNVYLSKSRYCKAKQCKKILWMDKYKPEEKVPLPKDAIFRNGAIVGEFAKGIFGEYTDIKFDEDLSKMISATEEALKQGTNIITEASFNYDNNFCSVDILKNDKDGVEIYEVKSSKEIRDIYLDDASYQYYILSNLGYNVKKVSIVYINNQYIRHGELELDKLFNIEDITETAKLKQKEIREKIIEINEYMNKYDEDNEPNEAIGM